MPFVKTVSATKSCSLAEASSGSICRKPSLENGTPDSGMEGLPCEAGDNPLDQLSVTNNSIMQIQVRNSLTLPYLELCQFDECLLALRMHCPEGRKPYCFISVRRLAKIKPITGVEKSFESSYNCSGFCFCS